MKNMWKNITDEDKQKRFKNMFKTMEKNGKTMLVSSGELKLFNLLKQEFPMTKHGVWFHKNKTGASSTWCIDFFIPELNIYVQFDGVYWHGLDRPLKQIRESTTKQGKNIYKKWLIDREQDAWFKAQNKQLIRITDLQFIQDHDLCMQKIKGKL